MNSVDDLVDKYNYNLKNAFDIHSPLIHRIVSNRPKSQWYTNDLRKVKREIPRPERKYRKQQTVISLEMFKDKCRVYKHLHCAKRAYLQGKFENLDSDKSFSISNSLITNRVRVLPEEQSNLILAEKFSEYFTTKLIRSGKITILYWYQHTYLQGL